jgi:glycerol-3-phosphate O-acyltransferase/dihydroxyacetone phosphate acyltransferase
VKGVGTIRLLDRKLEPLRIVGDGTQFLQQLAPHHQIVLPNKGGQAEVVEVLSDTELIIKKEFKDLKALSLLTEGTPFKCIPHVDQDAVYRCVHDQLNQNQCITIFPEGGSHDRAELLPLKGKS